MDKDLFVQEIIKYLGYPSIKYRGENFGMDTNGFDCSGFINFNLRKARYPGRIPRHCNEFFDKLGVFIHDAARAKGDLIFFSKNGLYPDHMGMLVSPDEYIHAPGKDGTIITVARITPKTILTSNDPEQIYFHNPIAFKRITTSRGRYQIPFLS